MNSAILQIRDLQLRYPQRNRFSRRQIGWQMALDHVSLEVRRGECLGIVGESGSGKTSLGRAVARLQRVDSGTILWDGRPISDFSRRHFCRLVQIVFQSPQNALDPCWTVQSILREPFSIHFRELSKKEIQCRCEKLLHQVQLKPELLSRLPSQLSGGQKQRIALARCLAVEPAMLICDEVVSALDAAVQSTILQLLRQILRENALTCLFISHDLATVAQLCDRIAVMRRGKLIEIGPPEQIFHRPQQEYTQMLLKSTREF